MEALLASLMVFSVAQFSLLWYRMGKVEQLIRDHCRETALNGHSPKGR